MRSIARCGMWAAGILLLQGVAHGQLLNDAFPGDVDRELFAPQRVEVAPVAPVPPPAAPRPWPQTPQPPRPQAAAPPVGYVHGAAAPLPENVQNIVDYYGGGTSQRALALMASRPSSGLAPRGGTSVPAPRRVASKPFQGRSASPTISPYLNLFREEDSTDLPNYYTFVRPQLHQQAINRHQEAELSRLNRQIKTASYAGPSTSGSSLPATGAYGSRFFNNSRYFPSANFAR